MTFIYIYLLTAQERFIIISKVKKKEYVLNSVTFPFLELWMILILRFIVGWTRKMWSLKNDFKCSSATSLKQNKHALLGELAKLKFANNKGIQRRILWFNRLAVFILEVVINKILNKKQFIYFILGDATNKKYALSLAHFRTRRYC